MNNVVIQQRSVASLLLCLAFSMLLGCGTDVESKPVQPEGGRPDTGPFKDVGPRDSGQPDTHEPRDSGIDTNQPWDSGQSDTNQPRDSAIDTNQPWDSSRPDTNEPRDGESEDDPCEPNPCDAPHKSVCEVDDDEAVCSCDDGYVDTDDGCIDPCESVDCGHGDCEVEDDEAVCDCDSGYHADGLSCVRNASCEPNPCDAPHKSVCEVDDDEAVCSCDEGYGENASGDCLARCEDVDTNRCYEGVLQSCSSHDSGLLWSLTQDCLGEGRECVEGQYPACGAMLDGDSCEDPILVSSLPYLISSSDFTFDFSDALALSDGSCIDQSGAAEAVLAVDLLTGEKLLVRELGDIDVVLSVQRTCGALQSCELSQDEEASGLIYTALADETVYVIVQAAEATPIDTDYEIRLYAYEDEICTDNHDNDVDGLDDCDDPDCFGETGCETEMNCVDGEDNDDDSLIDCADTTDCSAHPACGSYQGLFEKFDTWEVNDLQGHSIIFTPDSNAPNGYSLNVADNLTAYPVTPGQGTQEARTIGLGDDISSIELSFLGFAGFPFYGVDYSGFFVGSNGFVTFSTGRDDPISEVSAFFAQPIVAGLTGDLDCRLDSSTGEASTVFIDQYAERVVVTFDQVPHTYENTNDPLGPNSFQIILKADGVIELHYLAVSEIGTTFAGIGSGLGATPYANETNLIP